MHTSSLTNWILFVLTAALATSSIFYYLKLTNEESERLVAGALAVKVINDKSRMTEGQDIITVPTGAVLKTNYGEIEIAFSKSGAPKTVANFAKLAQAGFYDGVKFHRVIAGFMIQGGDPLSKDDSQKDLWGTGGPGYKFDDELSGQEKYPQGTVAMANSGPNTNGSQFFIVTGSPEAPLPPSYTVFGKVTRGMEVALKIEKVPTEGKGVYDRPVKDVIIESVTVK